MPIPATGPLSLSRFNVEVGVPSQARLSMSDARVRSLTNAPNNNVRLSNARGISSGLVFSVDVNNASSWSGSGGTWADLSGFNNHVTLSGNMTSSGNAMLFDGTNDVATAAHSTSLDIRRTITLNVWFRLAAMPATWTNLINKQDAAGTVATRTYSAFINAAGYVHLCSADVSGQEVLDTPSFIALNTWYNWTGTIDRNAGVMANYTNGVLSNTLAIRTTDTISHTNPLYIGITGGLVNGYNWLNGSIGIAQVYNRALTAAEVSTLFNAHRARYGI